MNENKKEEDLENQEEVLIDEGNSLDLESEDELPEVPSEAVSYTHLTLPTIYSE